MQSRLCHYKCCCFVLWVFPPQITNIFHLFSWLQAVLVAWYYWDIALPLFIIFLEVQSFEVLKCFHWWHYKFISREWSQAVFSWHNCWDYSLDFIISFPLASVQGISVTFVVVSCSICPFSVSLNGESLWREYTFKSGLSCVLFICFKKYPVNL